jgi:hypothetical protein
MKKLNLALVLSLSIFLMQSCQKDDLTTPQIEQQTQEAPELPTVESFVMPFTAFDQFDAEDDSRTTGNWLYSASNVVAWNAILTLHLAIPIAAFYESFNHEVEYQGSGIWLWAYDVTENGSTYHAKLFAELLVNSEIKWDMYISEEGGFPEMHWYSGITAIDDSYATWTLNYNPYNPISILRVDYLQNDGNGVESIRYTNIIPGVPENGGFIEYRKSNNSNIEFNRAYDVYKIENDNLLQINWNNPSNEGRVKDPVHFQDDQWHCWDTNLQDIDC